MHPMIAPSVVTAEEARRLYGLPANAPDGLYNVSFSRGTGVSRQVDRSGPAYRWGCGDVEWDLHIACPSDFVQWHAEDFINLKPKQEEEAMHNLSDTIEGLEQQLEKAAAALAQMKRFGDDTYPEGAIIAFDVTFPAREATHTYPHSRQITREAEELRVFAYCAIKGPDGRWHTSGPERPGPFTWSELVQWWTRRRVPTTEVWAVTQFEQVEA
jgi:hypothetical protein